MSPPRRSRRSLLSLLGATAAAGALPERVTAEGTVFLVESFEPGEAELKPGETFDVVTTLRNTGRPTTQLVAYRIDGLTVRSREITLDRGETRTVRFEGIRTESLETGEHTHGVYTEDTNEEAQLVVQEPPAFEVTDLQPRLGDTRPGERFSVAATAKNTGGSEGEQTVSIDLDDEQAGTASLSLRAGESDDVVFTVDAPSTTGEYTYTVRTANDSASGAISVLEPTATDRGSGNELLFALAGGAGALTVYGGARLLSRSRQWQSGPGSKNDGRNTEPDPSGTPAVAESIADASVIESAVDENVDRAETALADARRRHDEGDYARALSACYRARGAIDDAAEAAAEYAPDRVGSIESRGADVDELVERIEDDIGE